MGFKFIVFVPLILIVAVGGAVIAICCLKSQKKSEFLKKRIHDLGDLSRYTYNQIASVAGSPINMQYIDNKRFCTWQECETSLWSNKITKTYTITLIFDAYDRCIGISNETYI